MQSCPCIKHRGALIPKSTKRRCKQPLMEEKEGPLMEEKEGPLMEEEEDPLMEAARHFSCEMLDQVVRGRVSSGGINDVLKIIRKHYGRFLPVDALPTSWYMLRKLALGGYTPKNAMRDLCPDCDWMFPADQAQDPVCGRCTTATRWVPKKPGTPVRQVVYFDMADAFKTAFSVEVMADELIRFSDTVPSVVGIRERQLDEAWEGSILHSHMQRAAEGGELVDAADEDSNEGGEGNAAAETVPSSDEEETVPSSDEEDAAAEDEDGVCLSDSEADRDSEEETVPSSDEEETVPSSDEEDAAAEDEDGVCLSLSLLCHVCVSVYPTPPPPNPQTRTVTMTTPCTRATPSTSR